MAEQSTYEDKKLRYVVVDPRENAIILESGAQERAHPASLAKLFTLALVMEAKARFGNVFGDKIQIPSDVRSNLPRRLATTRSLKPGNEYSYEEALFWTGSRSEAQMTVAITEHLGKPEIYGFGTTHDEIRTNFLEFANRRLAEIGLKDTNQAVLTGWYNDRHYTTALDIAIAMDYMQSNFPEQTQISLGGDHPTQGRKSHSSEMVKDNPHTVWGKTGWLSETGRSQALWMETQNESREDRRPIIVVVTGANTNSERDRITRHLASKAYDIINSGDYNPKPIYEDVEFDPNQELPNATAAPKLSPTPIPRPNELSSAFQGKTTVEERGPAPQKFPLPRSRPAASLVSTAEGQEDIPIAPIPPVAEPLLPQLPFLDESTSEQYLPPPIKPNMPS